MKLTSLQISNVLGLTRADIDLSNAVTVISGNNAAGKSSIRDAISMAFLGQPCRVSMKKDLGQLLHDDSAKGRVSVLFGESDEGAEFRLPKGEHHVSEFAGAAFMPYLLDTAQFCRIDTDARRSFLFQLTNCKASGAVISAKLEARGVSPEMIAEFAPMLRSGFPSAAKEAYLRATQAKGAWRAVTGSNWGAVVAENWQAEQPEGVCPTSKDLDAIMEAQAKEQAELDKGTQFVGGLESKRKASESFIERKQAAHDLADQLTRRQAKQAATEKDLKQREADLPALQTQLAEMQAGSVPVDCPCCGEALRINGGKLEKFQGLKADTKAVTDLALQLRNAANAIDLLKRTLQNDIASVAEAKAAAVQHDKIVAEKVEVVDEAKIERAVSALAGVRTKADNLRAEFNAKQALKFAFEAVNKTIEKAAVAHADVKAWQQVGDALSPDGIPAEILKGALAPVNQSLEVLAGMCGWSKTVIREDMAVAFGERLYGLCSESEKWRADTLLALAIAQISGLKLVVLDRFDVLDVKSRSSLLGMLVKLGNLGAMETMIMCGTMKELPKLPAGIGGVWISKGIAELTATN